ncbi:MAG: zinc ABC transporter substrate-binding protein [Alphaproteobacteria bacterium]|nr:zinc ABC transporter substrate-binding protein [Alphaproteobacteria bacterium]
MLMTHGAAAEIRVVASIAPIHSLVAGVMEGVGEPRLLVRGGASPHSYALRPSDARALNDADLIFWVGDGLETFLPRILGNLGDGAQIVAFMKHPEIRLLEARKAGVWEDHDHGGRDPHIWLSPANAKAIARIAADALKKRDPANREIYVANAARVAQRIDRMADVIRAHLTPVAHEPFVLFHDSFRYFEDAFGLKPLGSVTVDPERMPGARRLARLRREVARLNVKCVLREPQFTPKTAAMIAEGTNARIGVVDPLGADLPPGPALYADLMENNARALAACLSAG